MSTLRSSIAFYTRTSRGRSTHQSILESQLDDLRTRAQADGVELSPELIFIDDGYSGAELRRPALGQLREMAGAGALHRLYVPCPDRLARDCARRFLLINELHRAGVEVLFLNHDDTDGFFPRGASS
jgi:site-specific DNA recombinase